jgi:hypothetical protein
LVKKTITIKDLEKVEVEIALNEEGATLAEKVTVFAGPFEQIETNAPSEKALNKTELLWELSTHPYVQSECAMAVRQRIALARVPRAIRSRPCCRKSEEHREAAALQQS